jgi:TolB-like protein
VQLEDAETTENLFANQYDYEIGEAFAAHDEIVRIIVGAIEPELLRYERERIRADTTAGCDRI